MARPQLSSAHQLPVPSLHSLLTLCSHEPLAEPRSDLHPCLLVPTETPRCPRTRTFPRNFSLCKRLPHLHTNWVSEEDTQNCCALGAACQVGDRDTPLPGAVLLCGEPESIWPWWGGRGGVTRWVGEDGVPGDSQSLLWPCQESRMFLESGGSCSNLRRAGTSPPPASVSSWVGLEWGVPAAHY